MCISQESVADVWIQAEKGGSGWAKTTSPYGSGGSYYKRYEYRLPNGGRYQVHVGCGWKKEHVWSSKQVWETNNKSGYVSGGKSFTCYDVKYYTGPRNPGSKVYPYQKCL